MSPVQCIFPLTILPISSKSVVTWSTEPVHTMSDKLHGEDSTPLPLKDKRRLRITRRHTAGGQMWHGNSRLINVSIRPLLWMLLDLHHLRWNMNLPEPGYRMSSLWRTQSLHNAWACFCSQGPCPEGSEGRKRKKIPFNHLVKQVVTLPTSTMLTHPASPPQVSYSL